MNSALNRIVAPSRQQVSGVDDNGVLNRSCVDKIPVWALDLQAAAVVLEK